MRRTLPLLLALLLAVAGCGGPQAPLDPWGPQAERIAGLSALLLSLIHI